MLAVVAVVVAYLVGSIDFAVLVARARGVDIYDVGSGNPGTANVARSLGWKAAAQVLAGDALKGAVAAGIGLGAGGPAVGLGAGLAAVVGHCFPIWHRFRGGKGVATGAGAVAVVAPLVAVALLAVWVLLAKVARISSVASLTAVLLAVPALAVAGIRGWGLVWATLMVGLIVVRHRTNISALVRGEERTLTTGPTASDPPE
jgi:glycerol-3-phosphate acyltransferase PlsY